ncbi:MAG: hypothetical protein ABSF12_18970, partial [Bryobacteraceae bacterium]
MRLSCSLILLASTAFAADPPTLRLPDGVRPVKYAADLTLLPDSPTFKGKIDIEVSFSAPAALFYANARELRIAAAEIETHGKKMKLAVQTANENFIDLRAPSEIPAG